MRLSILAALVLFLLPAVSALAALPPGTMEAARLAADASLVVEVKGWVKHHPLSGGDEIDFLEGKISKAVMRQGIVIPAGDPGPFPEGSKIFIAPACYQPEGALPPDGPAYHCSDFKGGQKWQFWVNMRDTKMQRSEDGKATLQVEHLVDQGKAP